MTQSEIRIATRKSPLAVWQAEHVATQLKHHHPGIKIELVKLVTQGDRVLDSPLAKIGGKGLFVKELEQGMLAGEADIAVHSMKDVPMELPAGLHLPVIMLREDPHDAFVSNQYASLDDLPAGARVGTSSLRRSTQLCERYPALEIRDLRGNVNTRLAKLDAGDYDAIILAAAGLKRLGFAERITAELTSDQSLPAIGQGAIGIECREGDDEILQVISVLDDPETQTRVEAERALNHRLHGGCQVPIAGFAELQGDELFIRGLVGEPDGSVIYRAQARGAASEAATLGVQVAEELLDQGAGEILKRLGMMHE